MQENQTLSTSNTEIQNPLNQISLTEKLRPVYQELKNLAQKKAPDISIPAIDKFINQIITVDQKIYLLRHLKFVLDKTISFAIEENGNPKNDEFYTICQEYVTKNTYNFFKNLEPEIVATIYFVLNRYLVELYPSRTMYFEIRYDLPTIEEIISDFYTQEQNENFASKIKIFIDEHKQNTPVESLQELYNNYSYESFLLTMIDPYNEPQGYDGNLLHIHMILEKQSKLASMAKSGLLDDEAREKSDQEFQDLVAEIDRIAENTNFNSIKMIDGSLDKAMGSIETNDNADNSVSTLSIKFDNNHAKYFNFDANAFKTTQGSKVITVALSNHGLQSGDIVDVNLFDVVNNIDDETAIPITVLDKDTFTYTTKGAAASATGYFGVATDGMKLHANSLRCYDLLDGNILNINGIIFTAKNTNTSACTYTGAIGEIKTNSYQTSNELAEEVKNAIYYYITEKGHNYEKLLEAKIEINTSNSSELILTYNSKVNASKGLYAKSEAGVEITDIATTNIDIATASKEDEAVYLTQLPIQLYGTLNDNILDSIFDEHHCRITGELSPLNKDC
ncbi:MAG: hypothetical protein K0R02_521 [Rickettsiaceae bacterium]|jgi:flagellin-like hook-associated protein FlgL|nr:hypothetical protein [Rickettsiaceae bacterium]